MIALLQRVRRAQVDVAGQTIGAIDQGLLVLVCAEVGDTALQADKLLAKILKLRIFNDEHGKMNRSLQDVQGGLLLVSQFTLAAEVASGTRPSFSAAAPAAVAEGLYKHLVDAARAAHPVVATGQFGADMQISLINDGPVTIPMRVT